MIFVLFLFLFSLDSYANDRIVFGAGSPLDSHQVQIITPKLKKAFASLGIRFEVRNLPSARSLSESNSGRIDGELHRVKDFHRISGHRYSNLLKIDYKMMSVWLSVYAKSSKIKIDSWEDLSQYRVSYYRGRKNVEAKLSQFVKKSNIFVTDTDVQAMKMLKLGRVDLVISESLQGAKLIASNNQLSQIMEISKLEETKIYSYIHKRHQGLIKPLIVELSHQ